jgi:DNA-binding NarL/FixJ family response regulator
MDTTTETTTTIIAKPAAKEEPRRKNVDHVDQSGTGVCTLPTLLLADDNLAVLEFIVGMLHQTYKIAAALSSGTSVVERAAALKPDLIILDISLGTVDGFEVARSLKKAGCPAKIIFLTLCEDMDFVEAAFILGASGYVFKSRLSADLRNAIDTVLSGGLFSSQSARRLF